jgi:hypothetical protein
MAWGDDELSKFLELAHATQKANYLNFAPLYTTVLKVNDCLSKAGKNLINPQPIMAGVLMLRCQYAVKTAAGLALAGQAVETFALMRSALEYAGYALVIFDNPALEVVFINRHQSAEEMKVQKESFKISNVRAAIAKCDAKLAENFDIFYQRCIDFGGHPNPHATFSAMTLEEDGSSASLTALAISNDPKVLAHALRNVAQVGLTCLYILQHIFAAKFELLGIRADIDWLRNNARL